MAALIGTTAGLFGEHGDTVLGGTRINHIARSGDSVWVVDGKGRLHQNGSVVATLKEGLATTCVQPAHDTVFLGASTGLLFRLENGHLIEDEFFSDAPGRKDWYTPWGAPADVRSMTVDRGGVLYINVHVGGILRYDNTGLAPTIDQEADVHQVTADPAKEGHVVAATAYGLAVSVNGHEYQTRSEGFMAPYCRAVAILGDTVFISASDGPRTTDGRVYRTTAGAPMSQATNGLPDSFDSNVDTHCIAVVDESVFVGHGETVWQSDDGGDSWSILIDGLPRITCLG